MHIQHLHANIGYVLVEPDNGFDIPLSCLPGCNFLKLRDSTETGSGPPEFSVESRNTYFDVGFAFPDSKPEAS